MEAGGTSLRPNIPTTRAIHVANAKERVETVPFRKLPSTLDSLGRRWVAEPAYILALLDALWWLVGHSGITLGRNSRPRLQNRY